MSWNYAVIAACLLLLFLVAWKEASRPNSARMLLRLAAGLLAVGGFACMALPVTIRRAIAAGSANEAVFLTPGYQADSVRVFLQQYKQQPAVYSIDAGENSPLSFHAFPVYNRDSLSLVAARYAGIHVFGHGFDQGGLAQLKNRPFIFHPSPLPAGIRSVNWTKKIKEGERLVLQGSCYNPFSSPVKILLSGLQMPLDSVMVAPGSVVPVALSGVAKLRGKAVFSLILLHQKDTIEQEPVPVEVDTSAALNMLVLASSPDFENRFLKDWLAKKGYVVTMRTATSTGKTNKLFTNTAVKPLDRINTGLLRETAVLISDPAALASLSGQELQAVRMQVADNGLGLIIQADSLLPRSFYAGYFPLVQSGDSIRKEIPVHTTDAAPDTARWQADRPLYIRLQPGSQRLVQAGRSGMVAGSALYGNGKIIVTTLLNSYSWMLAGNETMYDAYWSLLVKKAARKNNREIWSHAPVLPVAGEPVTLRMETPDARIPQPAISNTAVSYEQDPVLPFQWQAQYWPTLGWQTGGDAGGYNWFVYDAGNWPGVKAFEKSGLTRKYAMQHKDRPARSDPQPAESRIPVPKIYFFLVFLLGGTILWIEKKFS